MKLFCLPYAGGSESIYHQWKNFIDPKISIVPVELKGRGRRFGERCYTDLNEAVDDIFNNVQGELINEDYAIYGHSMGSLLAYELYFKILEMQSPKPKHMFFSGYKAPNISQEKEIVHTLPDEAFISRLLELGGTSEAVFKCKELSELFLPILRSDYKIIETYKYKERTEKLTCGVTVLNGRQDSISLKEIMAWKHHAASSFKAYDFEGNHFFINDNLESIAQIINRTLIES